MLQFYRPSAQSFLQILIAKVLELVFGQTTDVPCNNMHGLSTQFLRYHIIWKHPVV